MTHPEAPQRTGGNDAVCFTSGPKGATFGAGAIHAWLAADREPPFVTAGISTGALSAAGLRKCYRHLESAAPEFLERDRWTWYRRYLDTITHDPYSFVWKAIPDPVDFSADKPPVTDLSVPKRLWKQQNDARRHYHLLTKLGIWFAGLPVRVKTVASILVYYVRLKEHYGGTLLSGSLFLWNLAKAFAGAWWHLLRSPKFFSEASFERSGFRPLFGWAIWLGSAAPLAWIAVSLWFTWLRMHWPIGWVLAVAILPPLVCTMSFYEVGMLGFLKFLLDQLDLTKGPIHPFELQRRLDTLFGDEKLGPGLTRTRQMHTLLVCAALQQSKQIWPGAGTSLVDGLSAALAVPGIFPPVRRDGLRWENYTEEKITAEVIDGVAIRSNPIPAFFEWCDRHPKEAQKLERPDPSEVSLYVVYNVPIESAVPLDQATLDEKIDIVTSAQASLELEKRRDTLQEVRQTDYISRLEAIRQRATETGSGRSGIFKIFPDSIAPRQEIAYQNEWKPTRTEALRIVARGCRETLETLYRNQLCIETPCLEFLRSIAPRRGSHLSCTPGLPEVCAECTGTLFHRPKPNYSAPQHGVTRSYGEHGDLSTIQLDRIFSHLAAPPRVVFLGSGGVFRGAFHIGVIAAMKAVRLFPDLVLGASVGTLMGGALATIAVAPESKEDEILETLCNVFLQVSERVALTRTLKNAAKQLGIRARGIEISPAELRRIILQGSQADAGFAATGAPPALIDAISSLFMIPHRCTADIASAFLAGHFTEAVNQFLREVRNETLPSFDIQYALMGVSLLEPEARKLLGDAVKNVENSSVQPYHKPVNGKSKVSFFATTSYLNARQPLLLGRDFLTSDPTWDSIYQGLSSSAFPFVFAPRCEAEVLPGKGRTDRLFADGGMLDNLPIFPALEILNAVQQAVAKKEGREHWQERLDQRVKHRDIFIAAGLEADPEKASTYDTFPKIYERASSLSVTSKIDTFAAGCRSTKEALEQIAQNPHRVRSEKDIDFLDGVVSGAILRIHPSDKEHINPTFAFCRATGMDPKRVARSIADGCFQSLLEFRNTYESDSTTQQAFKRRDCRVEHLEIRKEPVSKLSDCPYFKVDGQALECPFSRAKSDAVKSIRMVCARDETHRETLKPRSPVSGGAA